MENISGCLKEADIRELRANVDILQERCKEQKARQEKMEAKYDDIKDLGTAITVMSVTLEHIVDHNIKQDSRQDKQDDLMSSQNKTLEHINQNLNELNLGQRSLSKKVDSLEARVDTNEQKHYVDLRDLEQEDKRSILKEYGAPVGIGATLALLILEIIKQLLL